ncbi:ABC transporter permease [Faecalitalea cylindroides]|uniref:ABC transporter permease n=1 Tax=Faecalitalea cylindroides TaxID=39483 RepID=UPI00232D6121|nr:ABC transporter permease [Faecalitalea cylindroides]MDB7951820.1 ABC transporter permease [Faecalitalea cylindroides]MDB7958574.1 ABC transporter permease [Faecalitalea cylindroides]MDB7960503.1 ABC transporter permease [Faecalitalea cylindroides]MDB7962408.1 ABC transporter permease [Faecalitalea cylindroides]MDB7964535.1 ABC transporter permease [Faecalitalea cylindroides]
MSKTFYFRLAFDNLKKNAKMYIPFVLSCILTIMMYYMVSSLSMNPNMMNMIGGDVMQQILSLGIYVITVFAVIFLFYTNSFLIKRRKREFGLFNILGMEKKHLSIVIALESIIVFLVSMVLGIGIGILLDKAFYLLIAKMLNASIALGFYISYQSIVNSIILFLIIFVLMYLFSLIQINLSNPIELLHGDQHGEKEPKTKWLLALIGLICLGTGYYMSVSIQDPVTAFAFFMVAVILVVIGTYMLFTAGSIVILKLLRKNKRYYYKTNHFISVSNMIYRMKQNAVGLGNICILSTMVLVMLSTTISLWVGMNDIIETRFPRDITVSINSVDSNQALYTIDDMNYAIEQVGIQTEDELVYRTLSVSAFNQGNTYTFGNENMSLQDISNVVVLYFITLDDYNRTEGTNVSLAPDEVLVFPSGKQFDHKTIDIASNTFKVKGILDSIKADSNYSANLQNSMFVVVDSMDTLFMIDDLQKQAYGDNASYIHTSYDFNLSKSEEMSVKEATDALIANYPGDTTYMMVDTQEGNYEDLLSLYASFLFIGIFLSFLFIMATVLIMYYKQITEGYEDKKRFEIMQKVGLNKREVKKTINSQVLTVFFLPLVVAAIHIVFAFPMIEKMLRLLYLDNTNLYIMTTVICFGVFALVYVLIYFLTSKVYYGIVRNAM